MPSIIMLLRIMLFLDRQNELTRLRRVADSQESGLVVVYGRRRVGKTRLLLEWAQRHSGLYTVATSPRPSSSTVISPRRSASACRGSPRWTTAIGGPSSPA